MREIAPHCICQAQTSRSRSIFEDTRKENLLVSCDGEQVHTLTEYIWTSTYTAQKRGWLQSHTAEYMLITSLWPKKDLAKTDPF